MQLLTFAHRPEAQAFFAELELIGTQYPGFFTTADNHVALLITGEGTANAAENLSFILGRYPMVNKVLNFGVCAGIKSEFEIGKIYSIRTHYFFDGHEFHFKSFTTSDLKAKWDLVTSAKRVLDPAMATKISPVANLIDREGHSLNSVCQRFNLPYFSYKIISDHAGLLQTKTALCEMVKEQAPLWSQKLLDHYLDLTTLSPLQKDYTYPEGLYFTQTQKRLFEKFLQALQLTSAPENLLIKIHKLDISPKNKTTHLLQELKKQLNPFLSRIEEKLDLATKPLTQIGAQVHFDNNYEKDDFKISLHVQSGQDLKRLKLALEMFSYDGIKNILNGEF